MESIFVPTNPRTSSGACPCGCTCPLCQCTGEPLVTAAVSAASFGAVTAGGQVTGDQQSKCGCGCSCNLGQTAQTVLNDVGQGVRDPT